MWMNEYEIEDAHHKYERHPVMGPATATLDSLMHAVNGCSDGWPYWRAPARAATRLMNLITEHAKWERTEHQRPRLGVEATPAELKRAYAQLRRFRTGHPQCRFRIHPVTEGAALVAGDPEPSGPPRPDLRQVLLRAAELAYTSERKVVVGITRAEEPEAHTVVLTEHQALQGLTVEVRRGGVGFGPIGAG